MADGYVTNYGNAENDGSSWETPLRSIQSAVDAGYDTVYVKGFFYEVVSDIAGKSFYGDGFTLLDGAYLLDYPFYDGLGSLITIDSLRMRNFTQVPKSGVKPKISNCEIIDCTNVYLRYSYSTGAAATTYVNTSLIANCTYCYAARISEYNTFYNIAELYIMEDDGISNYVSEFLYNIFSESNINFQWAFPIKYSLFHNCTFMFTGGDQDADETEYAAPTGDTDDDKLENIRTRMATVYGGSSSDYLIGCKYQTDGDLFIDASNENFYLVPGCTAASMSYEVSYVGKYPEGAVAEIPTDFTTYTNIDDDGNITDQTTNAYAETDIQDIGKLRHVNSLVALGERAVRNGNQVNADADLGDAIYPGTDLTDGSTYIVRTEAISLTASGTTRDVGETFIASADDGLAFTSDTGYVQEVYLDKPRCIEIKASKTDATLASATWIKLDLYETPMVNYDENGLISAGNLDDAYDADTAEKMYIRYWKARIYVQAQNLPG